MDIGTTRWTPVSEWCLFSFFFFSDTMDTLVVKKEINRKLQILIDGQIITVDFVIYPKTKKLKPTTQPSLWLLLAALCPSPVLDQADQQVDELHRQSPSSPCPLSLSLSLSWGGQVRPLLFSLSLSLSLSLCFSFLFFSFYHICFGWMGVLLLLIMRFFFKSHSHCHYVILCIYIYIFFFFFFFFTQPFAL